MNLLQLPLKNFERHDANMQDNQSITGLEDLSNEIFYEIFEYLDTCNVYEVFSCLNNRFRHLFIHLSLPYKINLDLTSKTTVQQYYRNILTPNVHRIISIHLSYWLCIDEFFLSCSVDSSFICLESLILNGIKSEKVMYLLINLALIPRLFSLSMTTIGLVKDPNTIHQLLFALPVLRYCNTTFKWDNDNFSLLDFIDKSSTIEHFVSKSTYDLQNFNILLSYMPRLVRLSYHGALLWKYSQLWRQITLANLTYFHLHSSISFNQFEKLMSNFFHQLQVLRISSVLDNDYLDSNRWERLISAQMPRLHIFDFQHFIQTPTEDSYHLSIDGFTSPFWIEHQWFFAHRHYDYNKTHWGFFYSINSNRYTSNLIKICSFEKINLDFTRHIVLSNDSTTIDLCSSQLTISCTDYQNKNLFIDELNRMIPLEQLTNLIVATNKFDITQVMELLGFCSNIQILTIPEYSSSLLSLPNENKNNLQRIIIREQISLEDVQELINALPRLKSLEIKISENELELIVRYLFKHINNKKHHLCLLGFRDAHSVMVKRLQKVIDREELVQTYSIEYISDTAYLWW